MIERRVGRGSVYRIVLPEPASAPGAEVPLHEPLHEPLHDAQTNYRTSEPVRPSVVRADSQKLVAHYIEKLGALGIDPVPRDLIGKAARYIGRLADDGIDASVIAGAIDLLVQGRRDPSLLPSLVPEAVAGPAAPRRTRAEHEVDRRFREATGIDPSQLLPDLFGKNGIDDGSDRS